VTDFQAIWPFANYYR